MATGRDFVRQLRQDTEPLMQRITAHAFVQDTVSGRLPRDTLIRFAEQEHHYVRGIYDFFGLCVLQAPDLDIKEWFIGVAAREVGYLSLYQRFMQALGMTIGAHTLTHPNLAMLCVAAGEAAAAPSSRIERSGSIALGGAAGYGIVTGDSRYGSEFDQGWGLDLLVRYVLGPHWSLGLGFQSQKYDAQPAANGMFHRLEHPALGTVTVLGSPVHVDGGGFVPGPPTAAFGSETRTILQWAGFRGGDVERLLAGGAVKRALAAGGS